MLERIGFAGAVIAYEDGDKLVLIDGHERREVAGPTDELPTVILDVTAEEAEELLATFDPIGAMAGRDENALSELIARLAPDEDLAAVLDGVGHLNGHKQGLTDPDEVPELPKDPITKLGDLWELGEHRVLCGDASRPDDYALLMDGDGVHLMLTDPPYGNCTAYASYDDTQENLEKLVAGFGYMIEELATCALLTPGVGNIHRWPSPMWTLCWAERAALGSGPWGWTCWQPVLAYGTDPYLARGLGRHPDLYVGTSEGHSSDEHPVAKPMKVWTWLMERGSPAKDEVVLDPFLGSGTTVIAAEQTGRICRGMEIDASYVDVTVQRWENFTGGKAKRVSA
jgi:hypothetical protein